MKQPIKMTPGDDLHLSLLMAPHNLNLAVGQFRDQLLGYGRAAFEAGKAGQCLHQIQEPAPATAMDALREAEAALEVAMARILKADPAHSICVTSEAKALVAVRAALAAPAPMLVAQPQLHAALFAARGALQHMKEGGKPTQSLLNEAIAAIDSVVVTQAAPAAVAVPDEREALNRLEAACDMRAQLTTPEAYKAIAECKGMIDALEELDEARRQARAALAVTPAAMDFAEAYEGARGDLSIWKRRALEAERDLRAERQTTSRLVAEVNAMNGPIHLGEAAAPVVLPEPFLYSFEEQVAPIVGSEQKIARTTYTKFKPSIEHTAYYTEQQVRALLATGGQAQADMPDSFREWFAQNYPADTIIVDPDWHAKSIFRMAQAHARLAAPQAQADARDAEQERWMGIGKAIERACVDLPAGAEINIHLEKDAGTVTLSDCDGDEQENFPTDEGLAGVVNAAIDAAIAAAKGE